MEINRLIQGDCIEVLKTFPEESINLIFADPPYETVDFNELRIEIAKLLNYKGIFCMERRFKNDAYEDVRIKNYGKTQVLIWQKTIK